MGRPGSPVARWRERRQPPRRRAGAGRGRRRPRGPRPGGRPAGSGI